MDPGRDQMSSGIRDDVALAAFDLLAGVKTARSTAFRCLGRLAVDHPGRWAGLAAGAFARLLQQQEIDRLPQSRSLPGVEVVLHCRALREIVRQQSPRRSGTKQ